MSVIQRINRVRRHAQDRGASAVEYGLLVAAIAALIVGTVFALGGFVQGAFDKTCNAIRTEGKTVTTTTPSCPAQ